MIASYCVCVVAGVLVANKVDLKERRVVEEGEGRTFAKSKELEYFECSAVSLSRALPALPLVVYMYKVTRGMFFSLPLLQSN